SREVERQGLELLAMGPHPPDPLAELGVLFPRPLRLEALPRGEAHVPAGHLEIANEPERPRARETAAPLHELRPRLDERVLLARLHVPVPTRVCLCHPGESTPGASRRPPRAARGSRPPRRRDRRAAAAPPATRARTRARTAASCGSGPPPRRLRHARPRRSARARPAPQRPSRLRRRGSERCP